MTSAPSASITDSAVTPGETPALAAVSVVVPVYNSARTLSSCLTSIRDQQGVEVELIVVDHVSTSTDATAEIADQLADVFVAEGAERVAQRNAGLARASHDLVAFIDSDMTLTPTVLAEAAEALVFSECGGVVVDEDIVGSGFFIAGRRLEKRLYRGDSAAEAARVFRTAEVRAAGGFDPAFVAAEDFDLSDRVLAGRSLGRIPSPILHDEGVIRLPSVWAKKFYYGSMMRSFFRDVLTSPHHAPASPSRYRLLRRSLLKIPLAPLFHPYAGTALLILKLVEFTALGLGLATSPFTDHERLRTRAYPGAPTT